MALDFVAAVQSQVLLAREFVAVAAEGSGQGVITEETVSPGGFGFLLFVALGVGTFLLWRSMNKQLKRVDFDEGAGPRGAIDLTEAATDGGSAAAGEKPSSEG